VRDDPNQLMTDWTRRDLLKSGGLAISASAASRLLGNRAGSDSALNPVAGGPETSCASGSGETRRLRERLSLDFGWRFHLGHATDPSKDFAYTGQSLFSKTGGMFDPSKPEFDDGKWAAVDIPHDWAVTLEFKNDPELDSHGYKPLGRDYPATSIGWYRRVLDVCASDEGRRIWIEFDGVFRDSIAVLNGIYLGRHASGYTPFRYDVSDFLNHGGKNILVVRVDATLGEGWWYEGGGIYRHVWLTKTSPIHVTLNGTFVTSEVSAGVATLNISIEIDNDSDSEQSCRVITKIVDSGGRSVAEAASTPVAIPALSRREARQQLLVKNPLLWSLEEPNLYRALMTVEAAGNAVDEYETPFGIRTIRFDPDKGFLLNDKSIKIKGTCNHQDFAGVGVALPDRIHFFRVEKLKEMGSNAYRMSHNLPPQALLDACDQLGMLVMDETRMMSSSPEGMEQLEIMIRRDRNHPCVVIWSIGNEEDLQGSDTGARIAKSMKRLVRRLDPTRPITEAMNEDWGKGLSAVVDVQGFNYHSAEQMDAFHRQFPKQPTIGTETASTVCTRGIYENDKQAGYVSAYDLNIPPWAQLAEYWWPIYAERAWVAGGFAWTGFDYRGEPTPYKWPCINSHFGIIDTCGFPKDNFYYYQAQWTDKPVLHLFPHWNWNGKEGNEIEVWCHTNLEQVELFLNGQSLGRKDLPRYRHVEWKVKYAPGTLEARGFKDRRQILVAKHETTDSPTRLALIADRNEIAADGHDLSVVQVQLLDARSRLVPTADSPVDFHFSGNGKLIGVGNGDPSSHDADKATRRRAFNGLCMAIVQSTREPGELRLEATSPGLGSAAIIINSRVANGNAVLRA
jgi:beta-galactosidase